MRSDDSVPFRIFEISVEEPSISVEYEADLEDDTHVLRVKAATLNARKPCHLDIRTTHPDCSAVALTIVWELPSLAHDNEE